MPVINENDTTATDEISFGDNDFLAAQVAILIGAGRLVLLTDTEGLHTADPRLDPDARLVDEVSDFEALGELSIGHSTSPLGSGGMRSKVVAAEMATAGGVRDRDLQRPARRARCARRCDGEPGGDAVRRPRRRATPVQAVAEVRQALPRDASSSTRAPRGRCARAAPRCCRSGSTTCAAASTPATPSQVARRRGGHRQGDLQLLRRGAAPGQGDEVRGGARGAAAGDRGGHPPRLLRARRSASYLDDGHRDPHRRRDLPRGARRRADPGRPGHRHEGRRAGGDRRRARSPARTRSSRPTRATWRRAARPAWTPRCWTAWRWIPGGSPAMAARRAGDRGAARPGR